MVGIWKMEVIAFVREDDAMQGGHNCRPIKAKVICPFLLVFLCVYLFVDKLCVCNARLCRKLKSFATWNYDGSLSRATDAIFIFMFDCMLCTVQSSTASNDPMATLCRDKTTCGRRFLFSLQSIQEDCSKKLETDLNRSEKKETIWEWERIQKMRLKSWTRLRQIDKIWHFTLLAMWVRACDANSVFCIGLFASYSSFASFIC